MTLTGCVLLGVAPIPALAGPGDGWELRAPVTPRSSHAMAYDAGRGVTVLFGGTTGPGVYSGETWEWNGTNWTRRFPAASPTAREGMAMAYDAARGVTVLFGGNTGAANGETWTWDGENWTQRVVAGPSARMYHAMAYDSGRGVTVLFGGNTGAYNGETWEWNGTAWTQRVVAGPSARYAHAMAYDSFRGVVVLFGGGTTGGGFSNETWEWNGTAWTQRMVAGPSARWLHTMSFDASRGVTVLFGGGSGGVTNETWEWSGAAWTQRVVVGPSARVYVASAFDRARGVTVLFGGDNGGSVLGDTWEWEGTTWTRRTNISPSPRRYHAMAYDSVRRVTVLFGGNTGAYNGETWEWNGTAWTQRVVLGPSPRQGQAMAYDVGRGVTVLFGGETGALNGETWEWNGTTWTQRVVPGPSPRWLHAMAYDSARSVVVLFGGTTAGGVNNETWEWNGTVWTQRVVAGPSARTYPAMAYDTGRALTVLFGGDTGGAVSGQTWEWNGTVWTQRVVAGPSARSSHAMAYDAVRAVTVLFGGTTGPGVLSNETWQWNGTAWTQQVVAGPSAREGPAMAYDAGRAVSVLFGGGNVLSDETWEWNGSVVGPTCNIGGWCLKGDMDENRLVQIADIPLFVNAIITDTTNLNLRCHADTNNDSKLNGLDVAGFDAVLRSPDSDGDGIPDIYETNNGMLLSSISTGTDPTKADTDGDKLKDGDEIFCTTAGLNLRAMGANPLRKNIFLECDWFDDTTGGAHSHRPPVVAVNIVRAAFMNSPVANPYGAAAGISMFVDRGQGGVFTGGNQIPGDVSSITWSDTNGAGEFNTHKTAQFAANRKGFFQYSIHVHQYNGGTSSGISELPAGDDTIVSLQNFLTIPNIANTIMHELGHNFSLRHGGNDDCPNYKPNYNSVMNYRFQFPGIDGTCGGGAGGDAVGDGILDYSRGIRIPLDEAHLNENHGVCSVSGPRINWNGTGGDMEADIARNINCRAGTTRVCDDPAVAACTDSYCQSLNANDPIVCTDYTDNNDWGQFTFPDLTLGDLLREPSRPCQPVPIEFHIVPAQVDESGGAPE